MFWPGGTGRRKSDNAAVFFSLWLTEIKQKQQRKKRCFTLIICVA